MHAQALTVLIARLFAAGVSGGAVVSADGVLQALVTSNARHSSSGATLPNLNFCLTAEALQPLWELLSGAEIPLSTLQQRLRELDVSSPALSSMWALSRQSPYAEEDAQSRMHRLLQDRGVHVDARSRI
jgi:hypothetical protein